LHNKVNKNKAILIFKNIKEQIPDFNEFLTKLQSQNLIDQKFIFQNDLNILLSKFKIQLTQQDFECLIRAFPARNEGSQKRIDVDLLLNFKNMPHDDTKIYQNIELSDDEDNEFYDASGYTGV